MKKIFSVIFITILFSSCNIYKPVEIGELEGIKLDKLLINKVEIIVFVQVKNPNFYEIKITGYDLDIILNEQKISSISSKNIISLPSNSDKVYGLPVEVEFKNMFSSTALLLFDVLKNKEAEVLIDGEIYVETLLVNKTKKINKKSKVKILK